MVQAVNQALTKMERVESLKLARSTFSHKNTKLHDYEIQMGADKALCLKLGYAIMTTSSPLEELRLIGECLCLIYQCSLDQRQRSFRTIGGSELAPLLVQVLISGLSEGENFPLDSLTVIVEVLRIYAKLDAGKSVLVRLKKGQWLGQVLQYCVDGTLGVKASSVSPLCIELLGLVKDLTFRSPALDKERILSLGEGAFGGLIASICRAGERADRRLVDWFTAVIWNLVLDKSICDKVLDLDVTRDFPVVGYMLRILNGGHGSMLREKSSDTKIRRNAISCIGNILSHTDNQMILIGGLQAKDLAVVRTLVTVVDNDDDSIVRRRAMRTLRCIACSQDNQIRTSLNQHDLQMLCFGVLSRRVAEDDENDRDTQIQACLAICSSMDRFSCADWPRLETILLQRIETSNDVKLIQAACACLVECIRHSPWQRGPSCFSDLLWAQLEVAAVASEEVHLPISFLLVELARREEENPATLKNDDPSTLTNSAVIKILIHLFSFSRKEHCGIRQNALETLAFLATKQANRQSLAENEILLSALVNLCLLQPDAASKDTAKKIIIDLVPEL